MDYLTDTPKISNYDAYDIVDVDAGGYDIPEGMTSPSEALPADTANLPEGVSDFDGTYFVDENGNPLDVDPTVGDYETGEAVKPSEELASTQKPEASAKTGEAESKAKEAASPIDTANETNAIQYAILILQAVEGMNQEDATRNVTVNGAQKLQDSQGATTTSTIPTDDTSLDGSNLSCAASSLAYLLTENPVDLTLLEMNGLDPTKTSDKIKIKNRRNQLLQQYAVSAEIIGAGSNAISSQFYQRVSALASQVSSTTGTLGAMSVLNDTERYPYFELVRQVTLSAVQLGLKGADTLSHVAIGTEK